MTEGKTATCTNCLNAMIPLDEYLAFDYMCADCFCTFMWWMLECEEEAKEYMTE